jgi:nitrate/TMAO reductase-like tetraheme cytochrome c subunit
MEPESRSRFYEWLSPLVFLSSNPISLVGVVVVTAATVLWLFLLPTLLRSSANPYLGIPGFMVLPGVFLFGLILIPIGVALRRMRLRREGKADDLPKMTLRSTETRRLIGFVGITTIINLGVVAQFGYAAMGYMETDHFCGLSCHVMLPEHTAYVNTSHARVECVECHIGSGASSFVKAKINGTRQLLGVVFNNYSRPIPAPVHNMRPAAETCAQCHWPGRFVGDRVVIHNHYADDEQNTKTSTVLMMKVGGHSGRGATGIHGAHSEARGKVEFITTDPRRQTVPRVTYTAADGKVTVYNATDQKISAAELEAGEHRRMDCLDCHNRPAHTFQLPEHAVDRAMDEGRISPALPSIKKESIAALRRDYADRDAAGREISATLRQFYQANYPQTNPDSLRSAVEAVKAIYLQNVFPEMKISWGTYPSNVGHMDSPGCFRCHDGNHSSSDGRVISNDCSTCHDMLAMDEKEPKVMSELGYGAAQH